ncbi:MAG: DUF4168 domain-containing protein [Elainella sp. Prado103]|jgi:hypothetical protein|nr:DUF4168 domain-containing protein [Elainella sp. Prado103]
MITVFDPLSAKLWPWLLRAATVSSLSAGAILLGLVPNVRSVALDLKSFDLNFDITAYAQAVSEQEIQSYARSVLAIEPIRINAYDQIQQITGSSDVPAVACHRPSSLSNLPENIRDIAIDYCNQAIAIVERNSLTISRFNQITVAHQSNRNLFERIQREINRIQAGG